MTDTRELLFFAKSLAVVALVHISIFTRNQSFMRFAKRKLSNVASEFNTRYPNQLENIS